MVTRTEHDALGTVEVEASRLWGAQTERSRRNFCIGEEKMPHGLIAAFAALKKACAAVNAAQGKLSEEKAYAIAVAADRILAGELDEEFPLAVWQTGSGTQTNMNVNEVIARASGIPLHENDDVNMSQSSNDTFPTAMSVAAVLSVERGVIPAAEELVAAFLRLEKAHRGIIKIGRTHLQDATPLYFSDEVSGWRAGVEEAVVMLRASLARLRRLAIGGTAVGTGLNAPAGFDAAVCRELTAQCGTEFLPDENKFHALTMKDAFVFAHGALKALAANLMKIANDVRWLASGPRCGIGEIRIPENEPGSSIMPGKVNPTQCEAVTMVAAQVMGNDATVGFAASQGNFELNVFMPVIAYNFEQSCTLLRDVMRSFCKNCVEGITADRERMEENLSRSLMLVTCLSPRIGYENAAAIALDAYRRGVTLREAALASGHITAEEFDRVVRPENMV
ncbi:MAG: class II fumarate hydratase [Ruminococcaceae bacterium]|nr:class II fumarate hydratase [Oscillospiraceae bacterium]